MLIAIKNIEIEDLAQRKVIANATLEGIKTIASDACILIVVDGDPIGWGDDYGTFHSMEPLVKKEVGEAILELYATPLSASGEVES